MTSKIVALLLTPPGVILLLALIGFLIQIRWRMTGVAIIGVCLVVMFALSLPMTGRALIAPLEAETRPLPPASLTPDTARKRADAIVVLGAGRYPEAPEYGTTDTVSGTALERLRYAAYLHRRTGLPVLLAGGAPFGEPVSEALLMQQSFEEDFQLRPKWAETQSGNTHENAINSKQILTAAGIRRIYLVTHAWHMPRAQWAFVNAGFDVVPAPMGFTTSGAGERAGLGYFPSARGLALSSLALHERLGALWYRYQYGIQPAVLSEKKPAAAS